ncbi:MAG: hypothetical protein AAGA92_14630 [Planctomycetota bacterium]
MSAPDNQGPDAEHYGWLDGGEAAPANSSTPAAHDPLAVARQQLVHGLLTTLYEDSAESEARVSALLARFEGERVGAVAARSRVLPASRRLRRLALPTTALSVVALLFAFVFWAAAPLVSAEAAIDRAIAAIESPITRVYNVVVRYGRGASSERRVELYSQSTDRFVAIFRDSPLQPAVAGSSGAWQWMLFGESTWSSDDGDETLGEMRARRVLARQVTLHGLLVELPADYDLELLAPAPLPGVEGVSCRPVLATAKPGRRTRARSVVVWPDAATGAALRVEVEFVVAGLRRVQGLTATLADQLELDPAFFEPESHAGRTNLR